MTKTNNKRESEHYNLKQRQGQQFKNKRHSYEANSTKRVFFGWEMGCYQVHLKKVSVTIFKEQTNKQAKTKQKKIS